MGKLNTHIRRMNNLNGQIKWWDRNRDNDINIALRYKCFYLSITTTDNIMHKTGCYMCDIKDHAKHKASRNAHLPLPLAVTTSPNTNISHN